MRTFSLAIPLSAVLLSGCFIGDAVQDVEGVVLDKESHIPIKDVSIGRAEEVDSSAAFHTDSLGYFHYIGVSGSSSVRLRFIKKGYLKEETYCEGPTSDRMIWMTKVR